MFNFFINKSHYTDFKSLCRQHFKIDIGEPIILRNLIERADEEYHLSKQFSDNDLIQGLAFVYNAALRRGWSDGKSFK